MCVHMHAHTKFHMVKHVREEIKKFKSEKKSVLKMARSICPSSPNQLKLYFIRLT